MLVDILSGEDDGRTHSVLAQIIVFEGRVNLPFSILHHFLGHQLLHGELGLLKHEASSLRVISLREFRAQAQIFALLKA